MSSRAFEKYRSALWYCLLPACAILLAAGEPSWKNKPIPNWTEEDARQILADSPWSKTVTAGLVRIQSEDERREGGSMGQGHGVGFDGVDGNKRPRLPSHVPSKPVRLRVRWESALPVQAAELKTGFIAPATLPGDGYRIAVYGVPGSDFKGDPKSLGEPLKKQAALKREGKKDVKPAGVEVFQREDGLVVVYLFPWSAEITTKDGRVEFAVNIGRIVVSQSFDIEAMLFQGKLEL